MRPHVRHTHSQREFVVPGDRMQEFQGERSRRGRILKPRRVLSPGPPSQTPSASCTASSTKYENVAYRRSLRDHSRQTVPFFYENRGRHRVTNPVARKGASLYESPGPLTNPRIAMHLFTRLHGNRLAGTRMWASADITGESTKPAARSGALWIRYPDSRNRKAHLEGLGSLNQDGAR